MKRKLLKQTINEWRSNLWLAIEMLVVSIIVWYICDYMYTVTVTLAEPPGFNTEHTYRLTCSTLTPESPRYVDYGEDAQLRNAEDLAAIYDLISAIPEVEAISMSSFAEPFDWSYNGLKLTRISDSLQISVRSAFITPGHIKVFDYKPVDPSVTQDDLMKMIADGKILITYFDDDLIGASQRMTAKVTPEELVGDKFSLYDNRSFEVGAIIQPVKRSTYESIDAHISMFYPIVETSPLSLAFCQYINVRVRPGSDRKFVEDFKAEQDSRYRRVNTYISDIRSYDNIAREVSHHQIVETRQYVACMVFMLVCVFLGLFGTFWFRTHQRRSEIAVRKVNGASNVSIFNRLVTEGLILLIAVTPIAIVCDWLICHYEFTTFYRDGYYSLNRFITSVVATFVLLAAMIVAGTWYPAWKAMTADPAAALKDE